MHMLFYNKLTSLKMGDDPPPGEILTGILTYFFAIFFNFYIVGNKAKRRISKRVFQESKASQIFRKTNIS